MIAKLHESDVSRIRASHRLRLAAFATIGCLACSGNGPNEARRSTSGTGPAAGTATSTGTGVGIGIGGMDASIGAGGRPNISLPEASAPHDGATKVSDSAGLLNDGSIDVGPGVCVPDAGKAVPG